MPSPSLAQVREQAVAVRHSVRDARVIGIRADAWAGPDVVAVDGLSFRVAFCPSPPHVREEVLEDCGHMLHHDQPARLARSIEAFLAEGSA